MEMNIKIGTAPDSWGVWFASDPLQPAWQQVLDETACAGYRWIELGPYGYLPPEQPSLGVELASRGLNVSAGFVMLPLEDPSIWPKLREQVCRTGELLESLGANLLVLIDDLYSDMDGNLVQSPELDEDGWNRLVQNAHQVAELARADFGLQLVFHPHTDTHVEREHQIERFLAETDPNLISLCLDTGHHAYRGGDPVGFLRRHHQRIRYLHLKNVHSSTLRRVQSENIPFAKAVGLNVFCEPSEGVVDFLDFRDALRDVGYCGLATVEQDMYPVPFGRPLPIAARTLEYFRNIGIGEP
jgi:inosose dehydratase